MMVQAKEKLDESSESVPLRQRVGQTLNAQLDPEPTCLRRWYWTPSRFTCFYFPSGGTALGVPSESIEPVERQFILSIKCFGSPVRVRLWFSRGKENNFRRHAENASKREPLLALLDRHAESRCPPECQKFKRRPFSRSRIL